MEGQPATRTTLTAAFQRLPLGAIPGFAAGFTRGPLAAASLGPEAAARALAAALGAPDAETVLVHQVHGHAILPFEAPARKRGYSLLGEGDGLLTSQPNVLLAVESADCVPVVLADPMTGWIAAVHAGWRGTAARVLDAALDALAARGVRLGSLFAAFGPSISRDRYEVGPEVVTALLDAYGAAPEGALASGADGKTFLDVAAFNEAALLARGVDPERIAAGGLCTAGTPDLPSWRRDGPGAGRILTGIVRR
ncbi:MAG TPA: polyphenol oxidase family protein [Thermoanaerobaculia bacterium]|nr:polyphenol oxidase family protein [Thermoanaerobaculia bacterium]